MTAHRYILRYNTKILFIENMKHDPRSHLENRVVEDIFVCLFVVARLRPMSFNALGYQFQLQQRCHPCLWSLRILSSHLSPVLAYDYFSPCYYSSALVRTPRQPIVSHFLMLSAMEAKIKILMLSRMGLMTPHCGDLIYLLDCHYYFTTRATSLLYSIP